MSNADLVRSFLRGQNLEQIGRVEEAIELYESIVAARFDAAGPYDRLVALYSSQARHHDVERVTNLALKNVQTHAEKRAWYERMRGDAMRAAARLPAAAPRRRP
jgi:hypothetical protein